MTQMEDLGKFVPAPAGQRSPRLIVLEINEISHHLLREWMGRGLLPHFRKLHDASDVFLTASDVVDPVLLEPWIQWYSIHTGLHYDEHKVFHLTDGRSAGHADVFGMIMDAGRRVANFSSMNVAPFARPGNVYLGDPWCEQGDAYPPELNAYNRFVSANVREHSNASGAMTRQETWAFARFAVRHGLSLATIRQIVAQLSAEKLGHGKRSWRRAALLDMLNFDVFAHSYARNQPAFATFFSNTIAHLQHSYWRYMDPAAFTVQPSREDTALFGDAIRFGYAATDRLIARFMALAARNGATLMLASALGQKPFLKYEAMGGQHFHRLHDGARFVRDAGIAALDVSPTMTHQYIARFASAQAAAAARRRLESFRLEQSDGAGEQVFGFATVETDPETLYFGCQISHGIAADAVLVDGLTGVKASFAAHFYAIDGMKSGCHDPEGCLWIQRGDGAGVVHGGQVSILDILPTQLDLMGVRQPAGARLFDDFRGRSLVPLLGGSRAGFARAA